MTFGVAVARYPNERLPVSALSSQAAVVLSSAASTRTSPPPMRVIGASSEPRVSGFVLMSVSAVFISSDLISNGERSGYAPLRIAAEPEIIGVAPEVPPKALVPLPLPALAETAAPGAPMSGLMLLSL
jgi:hypothetical protein